MSLLAVALALSVAALLGCGGSDSDPGGGGSGAAGAPGDGGAAGGDASPGKDADGGGHEADAGDAGRADAGFGEDGGLLPLRTGNRWTFRVTDGAVVTTKTQRVGQREPVGGSGPNAAAMAYRVTTDKDDGGDRTISWQAVLGDVVVRYREQAFASAGGALELEEHWDPYKLRVDASAARLAPGARYAETYAETKLPAGAAPRTTMRTDDWRVVEVDAEVSVPAGRFRTLVLEKSSATGAVKRYWFARGVGKVKETGTQTEELESFELAP